MSTDRPTSSLGARPVPSARVLVVEDEPQMSRFLQVVLTRSLIGVTLATTGETALLLLAKEPFDLVGLDISLPGMSGLDVCRRIKADVRLRHLPAIFLTVYQAHQMRAQAFALGAAEYLTKPLQAQGFLGCVTRRLALSAARLSGQPTASLLPGTRPV